MTCPRSPLTLTEIAAEADVVLARYAKLYGEPMCSPIDVDELAVNVVGMTVMFAELRALLGADVDGAIYFFRMLISIEQRLNLELFPELYGRYRFTLAHELGHWVLHRRLNLYFGPFLNEERSVKSMIGCLLILCMIHGSLLAADWDPNDDTFDPSIHSVVVGDASWLGDPSPFVHMGLPRTSYTHVNQTNWEGFDPSVQSSLMVPLNPVETTPQAGGMLMMNKDQTVEFINVFEDGLKAEPKEERIQIKTAFKDADWAVTFATDKGQRFLQLENKTKDKVETYRFSVNASKKLLGAIRHSLKKVESTTKE